MSLIISPPGPLTLIYKTVSNVPIKLDVYPPTAGTEVTNQSSEISAVLWFHGGGLAMGNRTNFFPKWLQTRVNDAGIAFISVDYRLIPSRSVTAHQVVEDVQDAFAFVRGTSFSSALDSLASGGKLPFTKFRIDPRSVAAAGSSAGGTCAYFAAMHVQPKPAALLPIFAMAGDFLTPHYLEPKDKPFLTGKPLFDPSRSKDYLYPFSPSVASEIVSDSPVAFNPPAGPGLPPLPANPRMPLGLLYLQLGTTLDYYTGEHEPSLSQSLREANAADYPTPQARKQKLRELIPQKHHAIFPEFGVDSSWPPTLLIHGSADTSAPVAESQEMYQALQNAGVLSRIKIVEGAGHLFDLVPEADKIHEEPFDDAAEFLKTVLGQSLALSFT
ncbi:Alpha/Beta hydrolase protein [Rhodocollybia butyracea]|uniref:Alpha/Beta hydrolase protein n=1 Tax=Rhodocollybia butyracea TaxID=206335 RepID=A0A9P5TYJ5_9AGAR|nr:Alpha/Beta hydrolase protein [Rhodocollybia butyracea]